MVNNDPTTRPIGDFTSIGFCQKKFYKVSVWNKAMKAMTVLVEEGYAVPCRLTMVVVKVNSTKLQNALG